MIDGPNADWVKRYSAAGLRVVLLHRANGPRCTCAKGINCPAPGKHPRLTGWKEKATSDEAELLAQLERMPNSNLGIAMGPGSGVFAVDIDPRNGGEWPTAWGPEPDDTLTANTGGGGSHHLFRWPETGVASSEPLPGVEIKADGRQIVVTPSRHASGYDYSWRNWDGISPPLLTAPDLMMAALAERTSSADPAARLKPLSDVLSLQVGGREQETWRRACSLFGYLWDREPDHGLATAMAVLRTMWQGMAQPPGDEFTWDQVLDRLRRAYEFVEGERVGTAWQREAAENLVKASEAVDGPGNDGPSGLPRLNLIKASEARDRPPMPMLVDVVLPRRGTAALVGPSGAGKTFLSIDLALAVTNGLPYLGHRVERAGPVAYVMGEGSGDIGDRIDGWTTAHPEGNDEGLWLSEEQGLNLLDRSHVDGIIADLPDDVVLVIFDTLAAHTPGAEENSVKDMGLLVANLRRVSVATDALVLVVHHTGWDKSRERGSSAVRAGLDTVLHLDSGELSCTKQRGGPKFDPIRFELVTAGGSVVPAINARPSASIARGESARDFVVRVLAENNGGMIKARLVDLVRAEHGYTRARAEQLLTAMTIGNDEQPARIRNGDVAQVEGNVTKTRKGLVLVP